ncbi:MAG: prepilin peptidase [Bacilli bacterium]|nr:prepilin peptidase [Bacilli bacterium]
MDLYFKIIFFILGSVMGSFFHVVATRLSNNESIIKPGSHCHICHKKLKWYELIPIVSYVIQGGKSRCCKQRLPISYLIIEVITGSLFSVCYRVFKFTPELLINLVFISGLIIVIISDIEYMIILDEVLTLTAVIIVILDLIFFGISITLKNVLSAALAFVVMYIIKLIGDYIFKRESLGGGDIKLMILFGLVLGLPMSVVAIFLATFIAFPIALYILFSRKDNMIPFGPFLSIAAIILVVSKLNIQDIINFIVS